MKKLYAHILVSATLLLMMALFFLLSEITSSENDDSLYGPVPEENYLCGRFEPEKHPFFVKLSDFSIPSHRPQYLRKEAAVALKKMYEALKKDVPDVKFWIQSSTRNWSSQKDIWERHWKEFAKLKLNESEIARSILRSSSMPGTSRHHWGTDVDINVLNNEYFTKGNGAKLYKWLKKYAAGFGFCQPYSAGRSTGYMEERWHWSYVPLAKVYQKKWNELFFTNPDLLLKRDGFTGDQSAIAKAPIYVNSIDVSCYK